jgi:hypothetical protein
MNSSLNKMIGANLGFTPLPLHGSKAAKWMKTFVLFVAIVIIPHLTCVGQESLDTSSITLFKSFLQNPPVLKEFVFTRTFYGSTPWATNADSKTYEVFWGRRQPDAFVFRNVKTLADVNSTNARSTFLVGNYQTNNWSISGNESKDLLEYWVDDGKLTTNNPVKLTIAAAKTVLDELLKMGAPLVDFHRANWNENQFTAISVRGEKIKGSLMVENNRPHKLIFNVAGNPFFSNRTEVIEYFYERNPGLSYIPNRIRISSLKGEEQKLIAECEIVSIETSATNLGESFFDAKQFYIPIHGAIEGTIMLFSNNTEYALYNGKLALYGGNLVSAKEADNPEYKRKIKVVQAVLVFCLFLPLIFLGWKFSVKNKK